MASITILQSETGKGVEYDSYGVPYKYVWNAHSFWPSFELQGFQEASFDEGTLDTVGTATSFNLSGFQVGNEVVLYLVELDFTSGITGYVTLSFEDKYGTEVSSADYYYSWFGGYMYWIAMGVRPNPYPEIWYNGTFYAKVETPAGTSDTHSFSVNNLDTSVLTRYYDSDRGKMWVEGDYLWYISYLKCKHYIRHNNEFPLYVGTSDAGKIWIDDDEYRLKWIDENGYLRKSKRGDKYWTEGWDAGDKYVGTGSTGRIFCRESPGWTEIHYVAHDGYLVRHGPGYVGTSGDNVTGDGDCQ